MEAQLVLLAGRAGKRHRPRELTARLRRVEAQEIDRLAHFEDRIDQSLSAFANAQRIKFLAMLLVKVGRLVEQPRPRLATERVPAKLRRVAGAAHLVDIFSARLEHRADLDPAVLRRSNRPRLAFPKGRLRGPAPAFQRL